MRVNYRFNTGGVALHDAPFGPSDLQYRLKYPDCQGDEDSLYSCTRAASGTFCHLFDAAGILCDVSRGEPD